MRPLALLAVIVLAGCADPAFRTSYVDDVEMPQARGGPYGADGTIHAIAIVLSFELDGQTHGNIGAHCGFDDWTRAPPTALLHVGDETPPTKTLIRMLDPEQDTRGVSHFGTHTYADWRGDHGIRAAFDHERTLGVVSFDPPRFAGTPIPHDQWLVAEHRYTVEGDDGPVHVVETLHLRDYRQVPVEFDRDEKMCM